MAQPATAWFASAGHAACELEPEPDRTRDGPLLLHGSGDTPPEMRPAALAELQSSYSRVTGFVAPKLRYHGASRWPPADAGAMKFV